MASSADPSLEPGDMPPNCPICGGKMEVVYDRPHQKVSVCSDCRSGLTVPQSAWAITRGKREPNVGK